MYHPPPVTLAVAGRSRSLAGTCAQRATSGSARARAARDGMVASCSLHFLRERLYLYSFLRADDAIMLSHFLVHYLDRLGVLASNTQFYIHTAPVPASAYAACVELLGKAGIDAAQFGQVQQPFTDLVKLGLLNVYIRTLPKDAWLLAPDVDGAPSSRPES